MRPRIACLLFLLSTPAAAPAGDVFKCTDASGQVVYTDRPCPKGSDTEALRLRGVGVTGGESTDARERRLGCAQTARPAWDLLPREASGQLDEASLGLLRAARDALATQCRQRLSVSALAFECRAQMLQLTQATAAAADPAREADRDLLQAEFDRRCGEAAILEDIGRHLRAIDAPG
jgi:hypothetical protein